MNSNDLEVIVPYINPRALRLDGETWARVTIDDMVFDAYVTSIDVYQGWTGDFTQTRISLACTGAPLARRPAIAKRTDGPTYVDRMRVARKARTP